MVIFKLRFYRKPPPIYFGQPLPAISQSHDLTKIYLYYYLAMSITHESNTKRVWEHISSLLEVLDHN